MSVVLLADLITNTFRNFWTYLVIFTTILGLFYTFSACAEPIYVQEYNFMIDEDDEDYIDPNEDEWTKCEHHLMFAKKYYLISKQICWFLPEIPDKDKAKMCFTTACVGAMPAPAYIKAIAITLNLLTNYGLACIDSYRDMMHFLYRAAYHADLYMFYDAILFPPEPKGYKVEHVHRDIDDE